MIDLIFEFHGEYIFIRIDGRNIMFANSGYGMKFGTIDNLKLDYKGVVKEFPDLKDVKEWRTEAIKRFKEHISTLSNEESISSYMITDLKKHGYKPLWKQRAGFRKERIK